MKIKKQQESRIKDAVKEARLDELRHYSGVMNKERQRNADLSDRINEQHSRITELPNRTLDAENNACKATRQANQYKLCSKDVQDTKASYEKELKALQKENATYRNAMG